MGLGQVATFFVTGLLTMLSPCVLPLYPGFLAYLEGQTRARSRVNRLLGLFVLLGVLTMMLLLGAVVAVLQLAVGQVLRVAAPLSYLLICLLGALMLLGANPFSRTPQIRVPLLDNALAGAYVYGLVFGPVAFPCSGPLVAGIFLYSFGVADFVSQLVLFVAFGLGLGLPLVALSFLARTYQCWLARSLAHHYPRVNRVGGLFLVAVGLWGLRESWGYVMLYS